MTGFRQYQRMQRLCEEAAELGFEVGIPAYYSSQRDDDYATMRPAMPDGLPIYNRDAPLFTATLEQLEYVIMGIKWARDYDRMLKVSDDKKRMRKEQDWRNKSLLDAIKNAGLDKSTE